MTQLIDRAGVNRAFNEAGFGPGKTLQIDDVVKILSEFSEASVLPSPRPDQAYRDRSTVIVCPTRGQIDTRVVDSWRAIIHAMNQRRVEIFARGYEVGHAYDALISHVLGHEYLGTWSYVLTLEDDNLPPPDAHLRLLECLEAHPEFDAVGGLYHTKDAARLPIAYGDPEQFRRTGRLEHYPVSRDRLDGDGGPVEVLGIGMGCTLWRMSLFREVPAPWFMTLSDKILTKDGSLIPFNEITNEQAADSKRSMTQDLFFCEKAARMGKRFALLPTVRVGHIDLQTGMVY